MIALAGVAVETGVIMLVYLDQGWRRLLAEGGELTEARLENAVWQGAGLRVRPVLMTATATIVGLLPILWGSGDPGKTAGRLPELLPYCQ
jgi:Cu(I)/Ag(I) efflux system membrane protein CusA/SilA